MKFSKRFKKTVFMFVSLNLILSSFLQFLPSAYAQSLPDSASDSANLVNPPATNSATQVPDFTNFAASSSASSLPSPVFDQNSSTVGLLFTPPTFVQGLSKLNFQAKEDVQIVVKNSTGENLGLQVQGGSGEPQVTKSTVNGDTIFTIHASSNLRPGRYKITVLDTSTNEILSTQQFTWGVLAINTNKSIFMPNETADIAMAVLDESGNMVCDAIVKLDVVSPYGQITHLSTTDGSIKVSPECKLHKVTQSPDYEANFTNSADTGRYTLNFSATTADKGTYSTSDRFEVRNYVPFDVERISATRVYPPETYPVKLKITANEAFKGKIVEAVPTAFQISQLTEDGVIAYSEEVQTPQNVGVLPNYGIPKLNMPFKGDYPVTLGFGEQIDDKTEKDVYKKSGLDGHDGIDFGMPEGTPILSVDGGKVILAKENWTYGTTVVVQHTWGRSYYGHLSKLEVSEGDNILAGQEIGLSGSTGLATGPHLHFGIKPNNYDLDNLYFGKVDPAAFLGIAKVDTVLNASDYPLNSKALVWSVDIDKGASFTIGYQFKAPNKSPDFYTIGPLQFITSQNIVQNQARFDVNSNPFVLGLATSSADLNSTESAQINAQIENQQTLPNQVVFAEIRPWQLAIDAATTIILTTANTSPWKVPFDWNNSNNTVEVIGPGGNGAAATTALSGGGGGGGAYAKATNTINNLVPNSNVNFQVGSGGTGNATWFNSSSVLQAGAGANATTFTGGNGGTASGTAVSSSFAGGKGGNGTNSSRTPGAGGGGAAGPNGAGWNGGNGSASTGFGGSGGGGNGGTNGSVGVTATSATGGSGGNGYGGVGTSPGGAGQTSTTAVGNGTNGGGGGGGLGINASGTGGAGGTGSEANNESSVWTTFGTCGGGGGGGSNARASGGTRVGGAGGTPPADCGAGGGGGGSAGATGGGLGSGSSGFIVITYTPETPTLAKLMKHGLWFSSAGAEQTFTF